MICSLQRYWCWIIEGNILWQWQFLLFEQVKNVMAKALNVAETEYSFNDLILSEKMNEHKNVRYCLNSAHERLNMYFIRFSSFDILFIYIYFFVDISYPLHCWNGMVGEGIELIYCVLFVMHLNSKAIWTYLLQQNYPLWTS